jgi:hypothetical protein
MISRAQMFALGVAWVGGWAFLFFTNPGFICRLARIKNPTAKRLKFIKVMGAVELSLVFTGSVLTAIFGLNS